MARSFDGWRIGGWVLLLVACLMLTGCGRKLTKANFDKVQNGMSLSDVQQLLGKGEKEAGDGSNVAGQFGIALEGGGGGSKNVETYVWESGDKKITVYFRDGKVTSKNSTGL
jgi:hypothetical protein